jgi:hypothetical protein
MFVLRIEPETSRVAGETTTHYAKSIVKANDVIIFIAIENMTNGIWDRNGN